MRAYKANWEVQGLKGIRVLAPGAIVKLEAEEAKPLVDVGALSPTEAEADAATPAGTPAGTPEGAPGQPGAVDLSSMKKADLVEYAKEKLGLALDINKTKYDLLAAIADAAAKQ